MPKRNVNQADVDRLKKEEEELRKEINALLWKLGEIQRDRLLAEAPFEVGTFIYRVVRTWPHQETIVVRYDGICYHAFGDACHHGIRMRRNGELGARESPIDFRCGWEEFIERDSVVSSASIRRKGVKSIARTRSPQTSTRESHTQ